MDVNRCPTLRATVHCRCYLDKETEMCRETFDLPVCEVMASGHLTEISILSIFFQIDGFPCLLDSNNETRDCEISHLLTRIFKGRPLSSLFAAEVEH